MTTTVGDLHPLKRLLRYASDLKRRVWLASLFSILNKVFDLAPPVLIGMAVEVVVKKEDSFLADWGIVDVFHQLLLVAFLTVVIWSLESLFEYAFAVYWRNIAQDIQHRLRVDGYSHLQKLPQTFFEDRSSGELLAILNDDINQLERFLDGGANSLLQVATTVVCVGAGFFIAAPKVAIWAFVPIPLILYFSFAFQKKLLPRYRQVREKNADMSSRLNGNIQGISTIRSYTAESYEAKQVEKLSLRYSLANSQAIKYSSAFAPLIRMAVVIGFLATLLYGGWMATHDQLSVGTYSVLVFMTQRLLWPLTSLGQTFDLYQRALSSIYRIFELMDRPVQPDQGRVGHRLDREGAEIEFSKIRFEYVDGFPIIKDLDVKINKGQTVAFVGPTGCGKSTLVKLLLRFYQPQGGHIQLDGQGVEQWSLGALRSQIGLVSQDIYLFHGTVAENIAYGDPKAGKDKIIEAAKVAEAHEFISSLPDGYNTIVGERGQKLSGGQRQRLAIARAVLKNPPILIFDEATSAVDNETEAAIQRSIDRLTKHRTTIIIAHRLSTIRHADRIFVMDRGEVIQSGTHDELLAGRGLYAQLWNVQTGLRETAQANEAEIRS